MMQNESEIKIGFTIGDPNGIGPEVLIRALHSLHPFNEWKPLIFGDLEIIKKINKADMYSAQKKVQKYVETLLPLDDEFHNRAKSIDSRSQPHLLDEILWALYERDELKEEEQALDAKQSALIYIMLWTSVEALNNKWRP